MSQKVFCNQCKQEITTTNYVKCFSCQANYHFSPCSPLSESTYLGMYGERKTSWKCHICKPRTRSPNTLYQAITYEDKNTKKQARTNDGDNTENDQAKKYKESVSTTSESNLRADIEEFKSELKEMRKTMDQFVLNANNIITAISQNVNTLTDQVKDLKEKDKQRDTQMTTMDARINKIEQQMICKNIEIKNVSNTQMSAYDVVKTIGMTNNVTINREDINKSYRLKKQNNKIIIEFATMHKKDEFMGKIARHRIEAKSVNLDEESDDSNNPKYIYINDELTFNNRRLLWLAKTKAKEVNWKYIWVKNGIIFARKTDNSPLFVINNTTDIELINNTN